MASKSLVKDFVVCICLFLFSLSASFPLTLFPDAISDPGCFKYIAFFKNALFHFHQFPLWNDFLGTVYLEWPVSMCFYIPFIVISTLFDHPYTAYKYYTLIHVLTWGPSFYFFMRFGLNCRVLSSAFASLGMTFSPLFVSGLINGFFSENITFPYVLIASAFFCHMYFNNSSFSKWHLGLIGGTFFGIMLLAGGSFFYLYSILFLFLFLLIGSFIRLFIKRNNYLKRETINWLFAGIIIFTSICIASVQFFPSLIFMLEESTRHLNPYKTMIRDVFPAKDFVLSFFNASFLRFPAYPLTYLYIPITLLTLFGFKTELKEKILIFWPLLFLFVWISWGWEAPFDLYYFIHYYFPGFQNNHDTSRIIIFAYIIFFILSGLGAEIIIKRFERKKIFFISTSIILVFIGFYFVYKYSIHFYEHYKNTPSIFFPKPTPLDNSLSKLINNEPTDYPKFRLLCSTPYDIDYFFPNSQVLVNRIQIYPPLAATQGSTPTVTLSRTFANSATGGLYRFQLLGLLNVKYITYGEYTYFNPKLKHLYDLDNLQLIEEFDKYSLYLNKKVHDRILFPKKIFLFLVAKTEFKDFKNLLKHRHYIFSQKRDFTNEIFIMTSEAPPPLISNARIQEVHISHLYAQQHPEIVSNLSSGTLFEQKILKGFTSYICQNGGSRKSAEKLTCQIKRRHFTPNYIELDISSSQEGGILYLGDPYGKNWKAYDNSIEVPVFLANSIGRGILLTNTKDHKILFKYFVPHLWVYATISLVFCLISLWAFIKYFSALKNKSL